MTQADLARATRISTASISRWATGPDEPELDSIITVARALRVTVDELVSDRPADEARILTRYRTDPAFRARVTFEMNMGRPATNRPATNRNGVDDEERDDGG